MTSKSGDSLTVDLSALSVRKESDVAGGSRAWRRLHPSLRSSRSRAQARRPPAIVNILAVLAQSDAAPVTTLTFQTLHQLAESQGWRVVRKFCNLRGLCFAVELTLPQFAGPAIIPLLAQAAPKAGIPETHAPRIPSDKSALDAALRAINEHAPKLGFEPIKEQRSFPGGFADAYGNVYFWEASVLPAEEAIARGPGPDLPAALAAAADAETARMQLSALFAAEFADVLRSERDTELREKIIAAAARSSSLRAFRELLRGTLAPEDLRLVAELYRSTFAYSGVSSASSASGADGSEPSGNERLAAFRARLNAGRFSFDRKTLARLRTMPTAAAIDETVQLMTAHVLEADLVKAPNLFVACGSATIEQPQCREKRLIISTGGLRDLASLLISDIQRGLPDPEERHSLQADQFTVRAHERLEYSKM